MSVNTARAILTVFTDSIVFLTYNHYLHMSYVSGLCEVFCGYIFIHSSLDNSIPLLQINMLLHLEWMTYHSSSYIYTYNCNS